MRQRRAEGGGSTGRTYSRTRTARSVELRRMTTTTTTTTMMMMKTTTKATDQTCAYGLPPKGQQRHLQQQQQPEQEQQHLSQHQRQLQQQELQLQQQQQQQQQQELLQQPQQQQPQQQDLQQQRRQQQQQPHHHYDQQNHGHRCQPPLRGQWQHHLSNQRLHTLFGWTTHSHSRPQSSCCSSTSTSYSYSRRTCGPRSGQVASMLAAAAHVALLLGVLAGQVSGRAAPSLSHHHRHRTAGAIPTQGDPLLVHTTKGPIRGVTLQAANGKLVDTFLGIPYAKSPLGKLRFRHPVPMDPWEKPLNCTERPPTCVQVLDTYFDDFEGSTMWNANTNLSEDCLTMLVWVPRPRPVNAAVLVWIYGGSFYSGTATLDVYDGRILASEENVIVVSFNYRVGSLGFLYLDHADAPGNAGLMDQVMALRWVQDNIHLFGGNPNNVTIFGESAGAVSVAFHLLSPLSRDLFSQAVLQSGGATAPWGYHDRQTAMSNGYKLAQEVKCPSDDVEATIKCLRQQDPDLLVKSEIFATGVVDFSFIPVVDGAFLTERPEDSMNSGNFKKCRILLGANRDEGTFFIIYYLTHLFKRDENVYLTREDFIDAVQALSPFASPVVNEAIIFEYTDWLNPDDPIKNRDAVDKIVGDYHFTCSVVDMAHYYSSAGLDVYMYYFVHRSSQNKWPEWMGVIHADEIAYIFGEPLNQTWSYRQDEQQFSRRIMRYWANFGRMGNPSLNPDGNWEKTYWPAHTAFGKEFLTLDVNSTQVGYGHRAKYCAFWKTYLPNLIALSGNSSKIDTGCDSMNGAQQGTVSSVPLGLLLLAVTLRVSSVVY